MGKNFYMKLGAQNLRLNSKFYIPYLVASSFTAAMFYIMSFLANNRGVATIHSTCTMMLQFGTVIIGIFSVIILFYINSFLMKRRQKELGLYNVLGMEKRHIGRILGWETIYAYLITMGGGIGGGILLSKLFLLILCKVTSLSSSIEFYVDPNSMLLTALLFGAVFLVILIVNRLRIHILHPVELLRGGNVGEKEPKANWVLAIIGLVLTGIGYYIALTTESPIAAISLFFVAVVLVIIGTYFLFTSGIVALLKLLKKNKNFYYKPNHFVSVSGLIYRMKQNAAGLASICVLATMVMVMVSTTISLNIGADNCIATQCPQDFCLSISDANNTAADTLPAFVKKIATEKGLSVKNQSSGRSLNVMAKGTANGIFSFTRINDTNISSSTFFTFLTETDYDASSGKKLNLADDEVAVHTFYGNLPDTFQLNGKTYRVKTRLQTASLGQDMSAFIANSHTVIVKDEKVLNTIYQAYKAYIQKKPSGRPNAYEYQYLLNFDTGGTQAQQLALLHELTGSIPSNIRTSSNGSMRISVHSRADMTISYRDMCGGLLFLGIFLSVLFLMATVLIIYYKQISEGYDDVERFGIMRKVGMSTAEVKKAIHSQVLIVFFLPLLIACIHMAASFKYMTKLLACLQLQNVPLFATCTLCTIAVFAAVYVMVYAITTRTYYKIVSPRQK